jgi:hypothetical protein
MSAQEIPGRVRPRTLSIPGADLALSSDGFLSLEELPRRIVFIESPHRRYKVYAVVIALLIAGPFLEKGL